MAADADESHNEVRLSVPALPEYLRLVRLTASGLASRLGFSYDEVEDLRLALDELCYALVGPHGSAGVLRLLYTTSGTAIEVEGVLEEVIAPYRPSLSELGSQILAALVDEHSVRGVGSAPAGSGPPGPGRDAGPAPVRSGDHAAGPAPVRSGDHAAGPAPARSGPSIWLRKVRAGRPGP